MQEQFWAGKRVMVTGCNGFIGQHMTRRLLQAGALVLGVSHHPLGAARAALLAAQEPLPRGFSFELHDLLDCVSLSALVRKHRIDTVIHLAASPIVSLAASNPLPTMQNNILGTLNVLEAARQNNVERVLAASSDKAYGDHFTDPSEPLPYKEHYALRGLDIYSASKVSADTIAQAYAYQFKMPIASVRCCNIYGPGDLNLTRLIPKTTMLLLAKRPPVIKQGHETVLREYLYIDDAVEAYMLLGEKLAVYYGPKGINMPDTGAQTYGWAGFNVGSYTAAQTKNVAVCENIKSVTDVIGTLSKEIQAIPPEISHQPRTYIEIPDEFLDATKIINLGFASRVVFAEGVRRSVAWYREHYEILKNFQTV